MRVYYKTNKNGIIDSETTYSCETSKNQYCCDQIKEICKDQMIIFGDGSSYNLNKNVNLVNVSPFNPNDTENYCQIYPIKYCPFCGERVKVFGDCRDG